MTHCDDNKCLLFDVISSPSLATRINHNQQVIRLYMSDYSELIQTCCVTHSTVFLCRKFSTQARIQGRLNGLHPPPKFREKCGFQNDL